MVLLLLLLLLLLLPIVYAVVISIMIIIIISSSSSNSGSITSAINVLMIDRCTRVHAGVNECVCVCVCVCVNKNLFTPTFAFQPFSRNCSPATACAL